MISLMEVVKLGRQNGIHVTVRPLGLDGTYDSRALR